MDPTPEPYTLGIDTSLTASGVAWLGGRVGAQTIGRAGLSKLPLHERIPALDSLAVELVGVGAGLWVGYGVGSAARQPGSRPPVLALVEAPDTSQSFGALVERTYLTVRTTSLLMEVGVPVGWVPSGVLKGYCIGKGGGKIDGVPAKKAVKIRATELWPENAIKDDNQADATVLAAMALDILGRESRVPSAQVQEWLFRAGIEWPPGVAR
jgi:hypothetical protein